MGFNAGSITGYMRLTRETFERGIEEAKAQADELEGREIRVPVTMETRGFVPDAEEVAAVKDDLSSEVVVPVKIDDPSRQAAEAIAEIEAVRAAAEEPIDTRVGIGSIGTDLRLVARDLDRAFSEVGSGGGLVNSLLGSGVGRDELLTALTGPSLRIGKAEAQAMIAAVFPSPEMLAEATRAQLEAGVYRGVSDFADTFGYYTLHPGTFEQIGRSVTPLFFGREPSALGPGPSLLGRIAMGFGGEQAALGPGRGFIDVESSVRDMADSAARVARTFDEFDLTFGREAVRLVDSVASVTADVFGAGGGGNIIPGPLAMLGNESELFGASMPRGLGRLGLPLIAAGVPVAGALGLALAGGVAGTTLGLAGTGAYGLLAMGAIKDISTAYSAHHQLLKGTITHAQYEKAVATLDPRAVAAAAGGLGSEFTKFNTQTIHPLQSQIVGQIVGLVGHAGTALPAVTPFLHKSVGEMGGFLGHLGKNLSSPGFVSFMHTMTTDLGPVMKDFGETIFNTGHIVGDFLKLFAGGPARLVGEWFVHTSGELANFMDHAKLGSGFVHGMTVAFGDLEPVLQLVWTAAKKLADALAPVGFVILHLVKVGAEWGLTLIHLIPTNLITAVVGATLAFMALGKAIDIGRGIITLATNPVFLVIAAVAALAFGIYELATHWHQVWTDVKNWTEDAWQFLDHIFNDGIIGDLLSIAFPLMGLLTHWQTVWGTIRSVTEDVWNVIRPIFGDITHAVSDVTGALSSIGHIGGGVLGSVAHFFGFAGGGVAPQGLHIVGETGPELVQFSQAGYITPNNRLSLGASGGISIVVQVDARGATNPGAVQQSATRGVRTAAPALRQALERGSGIAA